MQSAVVKKIVIFLLILIPVAFAVYRTSVFRISQNFYEIDPGQMYRSAQLSDQEMKKFVDQYQIKTVLSLRGYPPHKVMWTNIDEMKNLESMKINFVPVDLDDNYYPSRQDVLKIVNVLENGPFPILIHCRVGSDRTGMVAAMYEKFIKNKSNEDALDQLKFKFWHVRAFRPAMSEFINKVSTMEFLKNNYNECQSEFSELRNPDYVCQ